MGITQFHAETERIGTPQRVCMNAKMSAPATAWACSAWKRAYCCATQVSDADVVTLGALAFTHAAYADALGSSPTYGAVQSALGTPGSIDHDVTAAIVPTRASGCSTELLLIS